MIQTLNINTTEVVALTNKLEKLHRSDLPIAIRQSLDNASFDVKQNEMLKSSKRAFINRIPTFFKATSHVNRAKGFKIRTMKSEVGFLSSKLRAKTKTPQGKRQAVENLEMQEYGGIIKGKSFIPLDSARKGGNRTPVEAGNRLSKISTIISSSEASGKNRKEKFIKSAIFAGKGGFVLGNFSNRRSSLWKIKKIKRVGKDTEIEKEKIYSFEKGRTVEVDPTGFMLIASTKTSNKLEKFYIKNASVRIAKRLS